MEHQKRDMYSQMESSQNSGWTRAIVDSSPLPQRGMESAPPPREMPATSMQPPQMAGAIPAPAPMPPAQQMPAPPAAPPMAGAMPASVQERHPMPPAQQMTDPPAGECGFCITLAMAYIPMQQWQKLYEPEDGFSRGTIFEELDLPFMGKGDCRYD